MFVRGEHKVLPRLGKRALLGLVVLGLLLAIGWGVLFRLHPYLCGHSRSAELRWPGVGGSAHADGDPRPSDRRIALPLTLALMGTAVIVGPQALDATGTQNLLGMLLAIVSALTYAASVLITKRLLVGVSPGILALAQQAVAAVVLLPAALRLPAPVGVPGWGSLVILGVVHSGAACCSSTLDCAWCAPIRCCAHIHRTGGGSHLAALLSGGATEMVHGSGWGCGRDGWGVGGASGCAPWLGRTRSRGGDFACASKRARSMKRGPQWRRCRLRCGIATGTQSTRHRDGSCPAPRW